VSDLVVRQYPVPFLLCCRGTPRYSARSRLHLRSQRECAWAPICPVHPSRARSYTETFAFRSYRLIRLKPGIDVLPVELLNRSIQAGLPGFTLHPWEYGESRQRSLLSRFADAVNGKANATGQFSANVQAIVMTSLLANAMTFCIIQIPHQSSTEATPKPAYPYD